MEARRATIEYESGAKAAAHGGIDNLSKREPSNAQVMVHKGNWLLLEGKTDEALSLGRRPLRPTPPMEKRISCWAAR